MESSKNENWTIPFNPFPHIAILQQTTFRKILNVHMKTLWQSKNEYLWSKGLRVKLVSSTSSVTCESDVDITMLSSVT